MELFNVPILFLIFNRLDTTDLVFSEIKKIKPAKLFVASDGPRLERQGEGEQVIAVRDFVTKNIDWPCEVHTLYRDKNLGCKLAVSSAINWFFYNVEEGIVLEDDCLPDQSFFYFCEELLDKYRDNEQVMHIGGSNFQNGTKRGEASYYFSMFNHVWGWATWRRAWKKYDLTMSTFSEFEKKDIINKYFKAPGDQLYWISNFKDVIFGRVDTWDFSWFYCVLYNSGLSCIPNVNLVKNIGFGNQATHTNIIIKEMIIERQELSFPLVHPSTIVRNVDADEFTNRKVFGLFSSRFVYIWILKKVGLYKYAKKIFLLFRKKV